MALLLRPPPVGSGTDGAEVTEVVKVPVGRGIEERSVESSVESLLGSVVVTFVVEVIAYDSVEGSAEEAAEVDSVTCLTVSASGRLVDEGAT
jgi:hypothetical protein